MPLFYFTKIFLLIFSQIHTPKIRPPASIILTTTTQNQPTNHHQKSTIRAVQKIFVCSISPSGRNDNQETHEIDLELKNVTYHDACHLIHAQKISVQPREVIKSLPGIKYTELEEASWCCGSAGIYNVVRYEDSVVQLERKMKNIKNTEAKIVLTGNPGCMGQIKHGTKKFNVDVEVLHPVTLIKRLLLTDRNH